MENILELKNVTKVYDNGVVANKNVNFALRQGEIHALVGENGAGKSTLMKMLFGIQQPTEGEIFYKGKKTTIDNPNKAIEMEIGMVHQHFMLVPSFTVTQNMILGLEPKKGIKIDYKKGTQMVQELSDKYNFKINPEDKVEDLTVGMKQKVEILKALLRGAKLLILDEPTAVLTPQETEELFEQLLRLKENGHTIIFISHKLKEVKTICDRITIIRRGETQGVFTVADITEREISKLMVGRDVILKYDKDKIVDKETVLSVEKLKYYEGNKIILNNINFTVKSGQVLGIAGVEGNGQTPLIEILTGHNNQYDGQIKYKGEDIKPFTIKQLRNKKMSYVPEDRMIKGIGAEAEIGDNLIANTYDSKELLKGGLISTTKIENISKNLIAEYDIVCKDRKQAIGSLSGGNIQKAVVARECSVNPDLLIAEQPTRGVDVAAAQFIHKEILKLRGKKTAILLVSADLNEVMELSDSLIVMYEGEITAFIKEASEITEEELGLYMLGIKKQSEDEIRRGLYEN